MLLRLIMRRRRVVARQKYVVAQDALLVDRRKRAV
jgi:hypothetical protein